MIEILFVKYFVLSPSSPQVTGSCEGGRSAVVTLRCKPEKGEGGELTVPRCVFSLSSMFKANTVNYTESLYTFVRLVSVLQVHVMAVHFTSCGKVPVRVPFALKQTTTR